VALVLDASIAARWFLGGERSRERDDLLDRIAAEGAIVPGLFRWEMEGVLLSAERAGRIDPDNLDAALDALGDLPITIAHPGNRFFAGTEVQLARHYALTPSTAAYLALAASLGLPLATADASLAQAARDLGIAVVP
jgi:predicted nucleic acid-binding protein